MVNFFGADRKTGTRGFLVTDDASLQDALERHPDFNKEYYLEHQIVYEVAVPVVPETRHESVQVSEEAGSVNPVPGGTTSGDVPEPVREEGINNVGLAKSYLMRNFPEEKQDIVPLKSKEELAAFAKGKGIEFPNLK